MIPCPADGEQARGDRQGLRVIAVDVGNFYRPYLSAYGVGVHVRDNPMGCGT
jgi:hypothetical protein